MRKLTLLLLLLASVLSSQSQNYAFVKGKWFDGKGFSNKTFYSVDGILTEKKPAKLDSVFDLENKFVVPAFGDAHHHGIDGEEGLDEKITTFLKAGIFYVKNPNVIPDKLTPAVRSKINVPGGIDVVFSNGGITAPNGHPVSIHNMLVKRGIIKGIAAEELDGKAYYTIADESQLNEKWPAIILGKPDFIKTFVLFSEEFEKRKDDNKPMVMKGLDPALLKKVVEKAHGAGLRVTSHIETAYDFQQAVEAGVDEINHLPIPRLEFSADLSAYVIDEKTAKEAGKRRLTLVATVKRRFSIPGPMKPYQSEQEKTDLMKNQLKNLQTLYKNGVQIAIGSDGFSGEVPIPTGADEAMFLSSNNYFDNLAILKMLAENSPKTIFPNRKIGLLKAGYEANFLALDGDPIKDFENIRKISMYVKQGKKLAL